MELILLFVVLGVFALVWAIGMLVVTTIMVCVDQPGRGRRKKDLADAFIHPELD